MAGIMDIRQYIKPKGSGGGASTSRETDEPAEPRTKRQRVDSVERFTEHEPQHEPQPQAHIGDGISHDSDQPPSFTDQYTTDDAAENEGDGDLLGDCAKDKGNNSAAKPPYRQRREVPGPTDISRSPDDGPVQPGRTEHFKFKKSKGRNFRPEWYNAYPWMEYSANEHKVYCFVCRHFTVGECIEKAFTTDGFDTWKKCTGESAKNNKIMKHKISEGHANSAARYKAYLQSKQQNQTVMDHISEAHRQLVQHNREYIKILADTLRLTAVQNIAQRGHDEQEEEGNKGNFLEILDFLKKYNLHKKLTEAAGNAKYTHHSIQNAILDILCDIVLDEIKVEIEDSKYFSVLVDETKDLSKQEQMSFVIRYFFDGVVHEEFMGFRSAEGLDAESLSESILDELKSIGVDTSNLIGQGYDGASVMSGKLSGVQERIRRKIPQALYVHCFAHRLNLVIVETVKSIVPVADFFAILQSSYNFLSGSHVHEQWIKWQKQMYPNEQPVEFKSMSDTRWASQVAAVGAIHKRFHCFVEYLKYIDTNDQNRERALSARGLLLQLDQTFIYCMLLMDDVLSTAKLASDTLQSVNLDYLRAADLIEALLEELSTFRSDAKADSYFEESLSLGKENGLKCSKQRRQTNAPHRMDDFVVLSKLGKRDTVSDAVSMKVAILNRAVDVFTTELNRRFSHENLQIFRSLAALDPKSKKFLDFDTAEPLAKLYQLNLEDIKSEMKLTKRMVERSNVKLDTVIDLADHLKPLTMAFEELYKLVKISVIIPVSTAACERTFSKLKLIKSHLRTSMSNQRLKSLTVISVHRNRALAIDLEEVVDRFILKYPNTRIVLK